MRIDIETTADGQEPGGVVGRIIVALGLIVCVVAVTPRAQAQPVAGAVRPEFDVASIKPSQSARVGGEGSGREDISSTPDSLTMLNVSVASCLKWAYGVQDYQIDGPGWLNSERFDIVAKAVGPAPISQLRLMLQTLLAERFKLTLHRQNKERSVYALVLGKNGSKLQLANGEPENGAGVMRPGKLRVRAEKTSMGEFAAFLSGPVQTPVMDMTGLKGRFDFSLDLTSFFVDAGTSKQDQLPPDMTSLIVTALQEQLGLTLTTQKGQVEILVVDHAEKVPTEN